ncbi:hypothetical protein [Nocardia harenae]|uniref:hypothetical protein n=1 Tax=Nocardia harenae TaxID=358707 RepID=UPI001C3F7B84|nr:hypothetical protein [Nocardia harenae]
MSRGEDTMDFVVWKVADAPPLPARVAADNIARRGGAAVDWRVVAEASAEAVSARPKGWTHREWREHGRQLGLRGYELFAWSELFARPIEIAANGAQWVDGMHRAALMAEAGAERMAVLDPDWMPDWEPDGSDRV